MTRYYNYSDVNLVPALSIVDSRSDCDTNVSFAGKNWKLPIMPANMSCTISIEKALELEANGYFYVLHRFYQYPVILDFIQNNQTKFTSISLGIKAHDEGLVKTIYDRGLTVSCITIDIAHGHSEAVGKMIRYIRQYLPSTFIIAGNVATPEGVVYLESMGADAVKVGISYGKACTTYTTTGFGLPMFTTVQECAKVATKPIIADGGIRCEGDITKALVAGATMVMAGSIFAELSDSPAETEYFESTVNTNAESKDSPYTTLHDGVQMRNLLYRVPNYVTTKTPISKYYYGSASFFQKGEQKHVEGTRITLPYNKLTYLERLDQLNQALRSSISYSGGTDLTCLPSVKYIYNS